MQALRDRGFIDIAHPGRSRLFEQTEFSGPMFRVFTDEEKAIIIDWIELLRAHDPMDAAREPVIAVNLLSPGLTGGGRKNRARCRTKPRCW